MTYTKQISCQTIVNKEQIIKLPKSSHNSDPYVTLLDSLNRLFAEIESLEKVSNDIYGIEINRKNQH